MKGKQVRQKCDGLKVPEFKVSPGVLNDFMVFIFMFILCMFVMLQPFVSAKVDLELHREQASSMTEIFYNNLLISTTHAVKIW